MKTFRRSFWQVPIAKYELKFFTYFIIGMTVTTSFAADQVLPGLIFLGIMSIVVYPAMFTHFFYVIVANDRLVIQNSIFTFWRKEYLFRDIRKVEIKWTRYVYMKVSTGEGNKFAWTYVIGLVDPDDYDELMNALDERGVIVETERLDSIYPNRKRAINVTSEIERRRVFQKVFHRSLGSVKRAQHLGIGLLLLAMFGGPFIMIFLPLWIYPVFVGLCLVTFFVSFSRCYIVILTEYQLILRNGLNYMKLRDFFFQDIEKVKISGGKYVYMEVFTRNRVHSPKRYDIAMVPPADYRELVNCLKMKGVNVELENLRF